MTPDQLDNEALVEVVELLVENCDQALVEEDDDGFLPLHCAAAANDPSLDVVRLLLVGYPDSLKETDHEGYLPLHWAVRIAPVEVVQLLMDGWSDALQVRANDGFLPLHLAAADPDAPLDVVYLLLKGCPLVLG